eukprot:Gb_31650 [translate_table: standard]
MAFLSRLILGNGCPRNRLNTFTSGNRSHFDVSASQAVAYQWYRLRMRLVQVGAHNGKLLSEILSANAHTHYLTRFPLNGRTDRSSFKKCLPIISYEDVEEDILRIANGDTSPILSANPISEFLTRAIRFLEEHWKEMCRDIARGTLDEEVLRWVPFVREAVTRLLHPNPELAEIVERVLKTVMERNHQTPMAQHQVYRYINDGKNVVVNIDSEKIDEVELQIAVEKDVKHVEPLGGILVEYTSHGAISTIPAHYVLF